MTNKREAVLAKIRALLAKTVESGCTEHEEMLALDKARAMMDAYEVTDEELKLTKEEKAIIREAASPSDKYGIRRALSDGIADFCDCKSWLRRSADERQYRKVVFAGLPADVAFAEYLLDHLDNFVRSQLSEHILADNSYEGDTPAARAWSRRDKNRDFIHGCTDRINSRLRQNVAKSKEVATSNSRALVVVKTHAINETLKAQGIKFGRGLSTRAPSYGSASYAAGQKAGDRASFGRPIGQGGAALIGKK